MQNQTMAKQIATIGGGDKDKDSHKIWRDEVEEDLSIMGIKNRCTMARDCQSGMEEDCIGSQGPHQAVVLQKKMKKIKRKSKEPETNVTKMQKAIINETIHKV